MFDQSVRSIWLREQLWPALRNAFPQIKSIPEQALITVGYPSSGARGRSEKIRPCEVNQQWTGNENEQVFISIHLVYCDSPVNMAKAILFQAGKVVMGARWGHHHLGLNKLDDGTITAESNTQVKLDAIIAEIGDPPSGRGVAFPVREVQRARLRRYLAAYDCNNGERHPIIRAASDTLQVKCQVCGADYHAG